MANLSERLRAMEPDQQAALQKLLDRGLQTESGCIEWTGTRVGRGYGRVSIGGRGIQAHRAVLQIVEGRQFGRWEFACHHCDNPPCINPDHLFVGSPSDNARDMIRKGRANRKKTDDQKAKLSEIMRKVVARGSAVKSSKLSEEKVIALRQDPRLNRLIAADYGITESIVSAIKRRKWWTHV